jgi:hypothetical protein
MIPTGMTTPHPDTSSRQSLCFLEDFLTSLPSTAAAIVDWQNVKQYDINTRKLD